MKLLKTSMLAILVLLIAVMAGCSSVKPPKEALLSAMTKLQTAKSMSFKGTFSLDDIVIPPTGSGTNAAMTDIFMKMLKGAIVDFHGAMQTEPMRAEVVMDLAFGTADMTIHLTVPVIITKDKVWLKVPQIPGAKLPDTLVGKFVEIDLNKIAAEQKNSVILDGAATKKLGQDLLKTLSDPFDEKTYFSEPKAVDVKGLPEGYKGDQFIRFNMNKQNSDQAVTTIIDKAAPAIIDLLLKNDAYMKALQLKKEELEAAKKELADKKDGKIQPAVEELKKSLDDLTFTGGIQDGYLTYQELQLNLDSKDAQNPQKLAVQFKISYADLNKDVKFQYELPKDAVPVQQVQDILGLVSGS
ncbi:hypothetical protein Back11_46440 [Paenibacillus baekrokdamisoli]|uniref:Uncharacterized protein n=1 Tax=Paenibacillus baekrokdamisoli TaxID=1712516 RepID=A0A3G9JJU5_9BACL|nr:hypothetical protein [Paenibacillus baekrokdamisoli]MBB3073269.1 hypothetical protein [Paenibacillus baekrokdamisoli]BBH23299.1 hypothetical protein Back11_46440 [Paenibacillus baekrokdamisoli]